jgi:RNA polymerase sigma-70 factor (ECF subfamily)
MSADPNAGLREQVLALMPLLRAFGRSLTNNRNDADDLVQDTLLKALTNFDKFTEGTNLRAWLFTIMRNTFYSGMRKGRNEVADSDGSLVASLSVQARWACPMRRRPISAAVPSARSRAASTAPAPSW